MQFIVTALDGRDPQAPARRAAVREAHLACARALRDSGSLISAGALLNDAGGMVGSVLIVEFPSEQALRSQWLDQDPYVLGDVWREITLQPCRVPDFLIPPWIGG